MDGFISLPPNLAIDKDEIEDALDDAIGELGEVSGGAVGEKGMIIDLDLEDDANPLEIVEILRNALKSLGVTATKIVVGGKTWT